MGRLVKAWAAHWGPGGMDTLWPPPQQVTAPRTPRYKAKSSPSHGLILCPVSFQPINCSAHPSSSLGSWILSASNSMLQSQVKGKSPG